MIHNEDWTYEHLIRAKPRAKPEPEPPVEQKAKVPMRFIKPETISAVRELAARNMTAPEIADRMGMDYHHIARVIRMNGIAVIDGRTRRWRT